MFLRIPAKLYCTYILQCADGTYYVGSTSNLDERVKIHCAGKGPQYTALPLPVHLVYCEEHPTLEAAVHRERQIKRWSKAKKEALIAGRPAVLKALSKCRGVHGLVNT